MLQADRDQAEAVRGPDRKGPDRQSQFERDLFLLWPFGYLPFGEVPLIIGVLQFELVIHDSQSLKDKRAVVRSLKDRLHREHQCAVAEVAHQDALNVAVLGLALVGSDGRHIGQTLDRISEKIRSVHDAEVGNLTRQLIEPNSFSPSRAEEKIDREALAREMLARAQEEWR